MSMIGALHSDVGEPVSDEPVPLLVSFPEMPGAILKKGAWSVEEVNYLRESFGTRPKDEIIGHLGRPWANIVKRVQGIGVNRPRTLTLSFQHLYTLPETDRSWLACALDAEGTIGLARHTRPAGYWRVEPYISISNTDVRFVSHFADLLKTGNEIGVQQDKRNPKCKPIHQYATSRLALIKALLQILRPYLVVKVEQCDTVLKYIEVRGKRGNKIGVEPPAEELTLYWRMLSLNQKGVKALV